MGLTDIAMDAMKKALAEYEDAEILNGPSVHASGGAIDLKPLRVTLRCPDDLPPGIWNVGVGLPLRAVSPGDTLEVDVGTVLSNEDSITITAGVVPKDLNGNPVPGGMAKPSGVRIRDLFPKVTTNGTGIVYPIPKVDAPWTKQLDTLRQINDTCTTLEELIKRSPKIVQQTLREQIDELRKEQDLRTPLREDHPAHDLPVGCGWEAVQDCIREEEQRMFNNNMVAFRMEEHFMLAIQRPESFTTITNV